MITIVHSSELYVSSFVKRQLFTQRIPPMCNKKPFWASLYLGTQLGILCRKLCEMRNSGHYSTLHNTDISTRFRPRLSLGQGIFQFMKMCKNWLIWFLVDLKTYRFVSIFLFATSFFRWSFFSHYFDSRVGFSVTLISLEIVTTKCQCATWNSNLRFTLSKV